MTLSLCLHCGAFKTGAWCACDECGADPPDIYVSMMLTDHYLTRDELDRIAKAVEALGETGLDEETRFLALAYFLSRKWPKLLDFDIEAVDRQTQVVLDHVYNERLSDLPVQENRCLRVSRVAAAQWDRAATEEFQCQEDEWQAGLWFVVDPGVAKAREIIALHIDAGYGAMLQRVRHAVSGLFGRNDYTLLAAKAEPLVRDAEAWQRQVQRYCRPVKNGWSDRTRQQIGYFLGMGVRLVEMAELCKVVVEHKAGVRPLPQVDVKCTNQKLRLGYHAFVDLGRMVLFPMKITPEMAAWQDYSGSEQDND